MKGVEKLGPMAMFFTSQLAAMEQKAGMTLKNDLFGALDDTVVEIGSFGEAAPGSMMPEVSQVTMIKLKDRERFNAALEAIKKMAGDGFAMFEESEFAGQKVYSMKSSLTPGEKGASPNSTTFCYTVADDYVMFGQGGVDLLHKVLTRMKAADGPSIWEDADIQAAIAALPKDYVGLAVSKGGSLVKFMLTTIAQFQSLANTGKKKKAKAAKGPKGPKAEDDDGDNEDAKDDEEPTVFFDTSATPSDEVFAKYFGMTSSGVYTLPDGVNVKFLSLPVAGQ
jgi:hypothetical protein